MEFQWNKTKEQLLSTLANRGKESCYKLTVIKVKLVNVIA